MHCIINGYESLPFYKHKCIFRILCVNICFTLWCEYILEKKDPLQKLETKTIYSKLLCFHDAYLVSDLIVLSLRFCSHWTVKMISVWTNYKKLWFVYLQMKMECNRIVHENHGLCNQHANTWK